MFKQKNNIMKHIYIKIGQAERCRESWNVQNGPKSTKLYGYSNVRFVAAIKVAA